MEGFRDRLLDTLAGWGVDRWQADHASVPEVDLAAVAGCLAEIPPPLAGVHVGNFVGVSLAYLARVLCRLDEASAIVSIDPDLPHRGIPDTEKIASRLLETYGLSRMVVRVWGYSLGKTIANDGVVDGGYDPREHYANEIAPEFALESLAKILAGRADFVYLDGHHQAEYLRDEIDASLRLLKPGGMLFVDDMQAPFLEAVWSQEGARRGLAMSRIGTRTGVLERPDGGVVHHACVSAKPVA